MREEYLARRKAVLDEKVASRVAELHLKEAIQKGRAKEKVAIAKNLFH